MDFEEVIKKFSPTVRRIAYKLNGSYRTFNHDDLYQEAILYLWSVFRQDKLADKTDSYILQGCYFHLKNYIRKVNEKLNMLAIEYTMEDGNGIALEEELSLNLQEANDTRILLNNKLLAEEIQNGDFNQREKMIMIFLKDGLTTRDIGKRIGVSHVMVVKLMSKMREKCRKYIDC
ncbi:MAG: sigma-70 family RNA polymerase sigma factor [Candidatus Omnitrophota bacterium]